MNRLNMFFFGEERISLEDALYFYGIQGAVIGFGALTMLCIY